ncbi:hypothetical protein [Neisseria zalophi]|uniref:hypothetical protein n=1 Tax=Neisseria zalophi TaxID=640030 RepID=UPI00177D9E92|nr:hypothetical protein [Neisseria zalophi]
MVLDIVVGGLILYFIIDLHKKGKLFPFLMDAFIGLSIGALIAIILFYSFYA